MKLGHTGTIKLSVPEKILRRAPRDAVSMCQCPSLVSVTLSSYMSCSTLTHFTYTYLKVDVTSKKLI